MSYGLIVLTGLSLAMAAAMGLLVFRMLRDERRRSEARIAVLASMSSDVAPARASVPPSVARSVTATPTISGDKAARRMSQNSPDLELRPQADVAGISNMFTTADRPASSPRLAIISGVALIVAATVTIAFSWPHDRRSNSISDAVNALQARPLELLSLRYTSEPGSFTVTGLVQNPRGAASVSGVTATAFLFAADGTLLATGRAPLDFTTVAPGDESPFVIKVAITGNVARYRIGFRGADGRVIAHVDRRGDGTVARNQ